MATRSNIGILNSDGTVDYIYCHWDGYIENNGNILNNHYTTEEQVRELIKLGDISSLGIDINTTTAYGRDMGESDMEARKVPYREFTKEHFESYMYLFTPGKGWEVRTYGTPYWSNLNDALKQIEI